MEQQLWLAAWRFSYWYWIWGGALSTFSTTCSHNFICHCLHTYFFLPMIAQLFAIVKLLHASVHCTPLSGVVNMSAVHISVWRAIFECIAHISDYRAIFQCITHLWVVCHISVDCTMHISLIAVPYLSALHTSKWCAHICPKLTVEFGVKAHLELWALADGSVLNYQKLQCWGW